MSKLKSEVKSLLSKIAAEKSAEELGTTTFKSPDDGNTENIPTGTAEADYNKIEGYTGETSGGSTVKKTPDGQAANEEPAGHEGGIEKLTPDERDVDPKSGKDIEETNGPKAEDRGKGKVASVADVGNELLAMLKDLKKEASYKGEQKKEPKAEKKASEEAEQEDQDPIAHIKQAAEQNPEAFEAGYKFAEHVAQVLLAEDEYAQEQSTKVAAEADNAAIKVAEFLMGLEKNAYGDPLAAAAGAGAIEEEVVTPEEIAAAGGEMDPLAGDPMLEGASEEDVIEALAAALEAEGITPEELAAALEAEAAIGGDAGLEGGIPQEALAEEASVEEAPVEEAALPKEAMDRRVKIATTMVDRIQGLKKSGLLNKKNK